MSTESELREWRFGQVQAERMVSALLHAEGYKDVDPQHPLGGPDGCKDVLCRKDGLNWIAAAYFPTTTDIKFSDVKAKFKGDVKGVAKNNADAFAFFVNQHVSVGERQELVALASGVTRTEIYHVERIRSVLDSPKGCGIRLEYLRIPMTEEEQWAFWNSMNHDVVRRLADQEARYDARMERVHKVLDELLSRTNGLELLLRGQASFVANGSWPIDNPDFPTASLSLTMLCVLQRAITREDDIPENVRGRLRAVDVWIGPAGTSFADASHVPPPPGQLEELTRQWCEWWVKLHPQVKGGSREYIITSLAEFHHRLVAIHPFLDGNGRLACFLLDQASRELLNQGLDRGFVEPPADYYSALAAADRGDLKPLAERISAALN